MEQLINELRKYDVIFSGSYVLKLVGLLPAKREVNDIDLVFKSPDELSTFIKEFGCKELPLNQETYEDGFVQVEHQDFKGITMDCFFNSAIDAVTIPLPSSEKPFHCIKVQDPRQILQQKVGILYDRRNKLDASYKKHLADFKVIFK